MKLTSTSAGLFYILALLATTAFTYKAAHHTIGGSLPAINTSSVYDSIVAMDARWEDSYNNCKIDVMTEIINEDLEFYHDQGGLMTSKAELIEAVKNNICGKGTRVLKKGSIEVSEIPGYGAVEIGMHGFRNKQEPNAEVHFAKFVHVWKFDQNKWTITRVISLHQ
jgi:hypothetical protein